MCVNSFNICDQELKSLGTGVYLATSIIDHSCDPTAVAIFEGTTINIHTVKTISNFDWSKVTFSIYFLKENNRIHLRFSSAT